MKSLDFNTIQNSIFEQLIHKLPQPHLDKIIIDTGCVNARVLAELITREFVQSSIEEKYEPYLTKASVRGKPITRKLPEVLLDSIVKDHLGSTNLTSNENDAPTMKETIDKMTQPYNNTNTENNTNYELAEGSDHTGPYNPYKRKHHAYDAAAMPPVSREHQLMAELESVRMGNALHAGQKYIGDQHIAALNDFMNEQKAFEPSSPFVQMFKSVGSTVGRELKAAATAEISAQINRQLIKMARQSFPQLPQGPMADTVLGFAIPTILLLIASGMREMGDTQTMGISRQLVDGVETTAKAALGGVSRDAVRGVANAAVPMLGMVASLSSGVMKEQLPDGED